LVELFNKRSFRCDCGTARLGGKPCELEPTERDVANALNQYNHNYEGRFCWLVFLSWAYEEMWIKQKLATYIVKLCLFKVRCRIWSGKGRVEYVSGMRWCCDFRWVKIVENSRYFKCCLCEDWYHENCMNGGKQGDQEFTVWIILSYIDISDVNTQFQTWLTWLQLPECELFEEYVCRSCTERHPFLKLYCDSHLCFARTSKKVSSQSNLGDRSIDSKADSIPSDESRITTDSDNNRSQLAESSKRKIVDDQKSTPLKKPKSLSGPTCRLEKFASNNVDENYLDLFCVSGWRDDLCRCAKVCFIWYIKQCKFRLVLRD